MRRSNSDLIYIIRGLWSIIIIQSISVPYFMSRGLSNGDILFLNSIFSLALILFEIPTGALTDIIGGSISVVAASLLRGIGATILAFAQGLTPMLVGYTFIALANTLMSGADLVLLYEDESGNTPGKLASLHKYAYSAAAVAAPMAGFLATTFTIDSVIYLNMAVAWLPMAFSLMLKRKKNWKTSSSDSASFKEKLSLIIKTKNRATLKYAYSSIALNFLYLILFYGIPIYWGLNRVSLMHFGFLYAASYAVNVWVSGLHGRGAAKYCMWGGFAAITLTCINPLVGSYLIFIVFLPFINVLTQVTLRGKINTCISDEIRATANSIITFFGRLLFFLASTIFMMLGFGS